MEQYGPLKRLITISQPLNIAFCCVSKLRRAATPMRYDAKDPRTRICHSLIDKTLTSNIRPQQPLTNLFVFHSANHGTDG